MFTSGELPAYSWKHLHKSASIAVNQTETYRTGTRPVIFPSRPGLFFLTWKYHIKNVTVRHVLILYTMTTYHGFGYVDWYLEDFATRALNLLHVKLRPSLPASSAYLYKTITLMRLIHGGCPWLFISDYWIGVTNTNVQFLQNIWIFNDLRGQFLL